MITICPACGKANASADTCRACGMPLQEQAATSQPPTTHAALPATDAPRPATVPPDSTLSAGISSRDAVFERETIKLTTTYYAARGAQDALVSLTLYFPHVLVAGHPSSLVVKIKNLTPDPLDEIELLLESQGLARPVSERIEQMSPGRLLRLQLPLEPARAGSFVLQCTLKLKVEGQLKGLIGARPLSVNAAPKDPTQALDGRLILTNCEPETASKDDAAAETFCVRAANLTELLELKLPEEFQPVKLALDYQISLEAVTYSTEQQARQLIIQRLFLGYVQSGAVLKLTPMDPTKARALHLVTRPQFKIGRNRSAADFITWFWPRSKTNDEKTRHLSQVHVIAECLDKTPTLRDAGSYGGSTFDGQPLAVNRTEPVNRRAPLVLCGEYFLDVLPVASAYAGDLEIRNIKLWNGPEAPPKAARGAVRFCPINTALAHHDAVWLFTDAAFGTSRSNPIALDVPGLAEIQGRFHHYRGCFWLENRAANQAVSVNSQVLNANEIVPLMNGLIVQLGEVSYRTEVVA